MSRPQTLRISDQHIAFVGEFGETTMHRHGALVLLAGLSGRVTVRLATSSETIECSSALIDANEAHAVDFRGEYVGAVYFEPESLATILFRNRFLREAPVAFDVISAAQFTGGLTEKLLSAQATDMFSFSVRSSDPNPIDPRVGAVIAALRGAGGGAPDRNELSRQLSLSPSRFSHLFKEQTRVSFQRYRLWSQVKRFAADVCTSRDYTKAALESGFYDAAHMNNTFRSFFGVAPSKVLKTLDEVSISR